MLRHFIPRNDDRVFAFTLAEVLITLVIIGVVAALTIPNLMTKYQHHVLENQFKKSLYTISQLVASTKSALGVSRLNAYCSEYDGKKYYNAPECYTEINNYIKKLQSTKYKGTTSVYQIIRGTTNDPIKTYNNKNNITYSGDTFSYPIIYTNKLADGSYLGFYVNNFSLQFGVDLNGNKKPNRLGYDIFIFFLNNQNDAVSAFLNKTPTNISDSDLNNLSSNDEPEANKTLWYGTSCNLHSERPGNGLGCSYYALRNKCPYDDTKTYWECLK